MRPFTLQNERLGKVLGSSPMRTIGDRIVPGAYFLHSSFDTVRNYLKIDDSASKASLLSFVTSSVGSSGYNIVWDDSNVPLPSAENLEVTADGLSFGNVFFSFSEVPVFDSHWFPQRFGEWRAEPRIWAFSFLAPESFSFLLYDSLRKCEGSAFDLALQNAAMRAVDRLVSGFLDEGVCALRGLGRGLTPSGDDFLSGLLAALAILEAMDGKSRRGMRMRVLENALGGNPLSNAFLLAAAEGSFSARQKDFFDACWYGSQQEFAEAIRGVVAAGATSGSDFVVGFLHTMERECAR
jgi:hypothetical protein